MAIVSETSAILRRVCAPLLFIIFDYLAILLAERMAFGMHAIYDTLMGNPYHVPNAYLFFWIPRFRCVPCHLADLHKDAANHRYGTADLLCCVLCTDHLHPYTILYAGKYACVASLCRPVWVPDTF